MDRIIDFWQSNWMEQDEYSGMPPWEMALHRQSMIDETDDLLEDAIRFCQETSEVSASLLQRRLNVGYPRAGRLMDALYKLGVVGPDPGAGRPRQVLIDKEIDPGTYLVNWKMGR